MSGQHPRDRTNWPTVPGWYWFRENADCPWCCVNIYEAEGEPDLMLENGMDDINHVGNCPGEYVGPIPEPEKEQASRVECECVNWCRDGRDMSPHHPRCKHHTPEPPDPRHAVFGRLMWGLIVKLGEDFFNDEWSEYVLPLAQHAGLCKRVAYDPAKHGQGIEAEPGQEIWFWGEEKTGGEA